MDCARSAVRSVLIGAGLAFASIIGAADSPLLAARWLAPAAQQHALAFEPVECLGLQPDPELAGRIAIGRAAFRTPLLLGGHAARAGLSCNSCHRNGRGNPDFLFPGLSGAPGTADVTSSLMSSHRGDGVVNPVAIPDLGSPRAQLKISRAARDPALEQFISGLIEKEFDGPKPSALTLAGVADYVRALAPEHCREPAEQALHLATYLSDARAALQAALVTESAGDAVATRLMLASARSALGMIEERYRAPALASERKGLLQADRELAAIQNALDNQGGDVSLRIVAWVATMSRWTRALQHAEARSLFNADIHAAYAAD
jgi:hypothetical protein